MKELQIVEGATVWVGDGLIRIEDRGMGDSLVNILDPDHKAFLSSEDCIITIMHTLAVDTRIARLIRGLSEIKKSAPHFVQLTYMDETRSL